MKPENRFIAKVHAHLPSVYRLKNHNMYNAGVADVYYSGTAGDLWVEYKWLPKTPTKPIRLLDLLTPLQQSWAQERAQEGRNVWVVLGHPGGAWVIDLCREDTTGAYAPAWYTTYTPKQLATAIYTHTGDRACISKLVGELPTHSGTFTAGSSQSSR